MNRLKNNDYIILIIVIILFFISDAFNCIIGFRMNGDSYAKFSIYFRALFQAFLFVWIIFNKIDKKEFNAILIPSMFLISASIFSYLILLTNIDNGSFSTYLPLLNKTFFFFFSFIFVSNTFDTINRNQQKNISRIYNIVICINGFSALLGFLFDIPLFKTYRNERFGYTGFIPATNEASLFWLIALFYSFYTYRKTKTIYPLIASIIGNLLLGTKASWLVLIIGISWFIYHFYPKKGRKLVVSLSVLLIFLSVIYSKKISDYINSLEIFSFFIYRLDKSDAFSVFLSGRDEFFYRFIDTLSEWSFTNYLFGGISMKNGDYVITEMDILDIIMFLGFLGSIIYLLIYKHIFSKINKDYKYIFSIMFFSMAFISGHVFWSALNAIYLCLFICSVKSSDNLKLL